MTVMGRGSADEAVVAVKLEADEDAVTYLRVKLPASDMEVGGEGWSMLPRFGNSFETVIMSLAVWNITRIEDVLFSHTDDMQSREVMMQREVK